LQERQVGRTSDRGVAGTIAGRERYGRTMAWDAEFEKKVAALTAESVSSAFKRYIDPSAISVVKAGDFKKAGVYR
jgi:zinc protease